LNVVLGAFREFFDSVKLKAIPRIGGGGIHESPVWRPAYTFEHTVCRADADRIKVLEGGAHLHSDHVFWHDAPVYFAQFSADGQRVVTASSDGTARLWDLPIVMSKDREEDVLLLVDLAEATCGFALQTAGQTEILAALTP
jgi:WD40 repeat protein